MKHLFLLSIILLAGTATAKQPASEFFTSLKDTTFVGADADARLNKYVGELKAMDIDIKAPEGFRSIDMRGRQGFRSYLGMTLNCIGLEDSAKNAVILWPTLTFADKQNMVKIDHHIEGDLRASYGDLDLDVRPIIEVIPGKNLPDYANADTAVVYEYEMRSGFNGNPRPFLDRYEHAVGVYLRKYGHPDMLFKIVLTDEGLKHKDEYIRQLLDNVKFGNNPAEEFVEAEKKTAGKNMLNFPTHACRGGIIIPPVSGALYDNAVRSNGGQELLDKVDEYHRNNKTDVYSHRADKSDETPLTPFGQYCRDLEYFDVTISAPEDFSEIDMRNRTRLDRSINPAYPSDEETYAVGIESPDAQAAFLFPKIDADSRRQIIRKGHVVEDELRFNRKDLALDVRPLIEVTEGKDLPQYANADTAVVYTLEFDYLNPFINYRHCVGVYLRKYGHPALLLKIALTDEGLKNKDKYIRQLLDNVRYGDEINPIIELQEQRLGSVRDLDFPSAVYKNDGFIISPVEQALFKVWDKGGKEAYRILKDE